MKRIKFKIPTKVKVGLQRTLAKYRNNKAKVQTVVGIVGFTATTVGAIVATVKSEKAVREATTEIRTIKTLRADDIIDAKEARSDMTHAYLKLGARLALNYAPVVAGGIFSGFEIMHACNAMGKTISGLGAALSASTMEFNNYRQQVINEYGADVDKKLYEKSRETKALVAAENSSGSQSEALELSPAIDQSICDLIIDKSYDFWCDDMSYVDNVINGKIRYLNTKLIARQQDGRPGWITLVDIWDDFGYEYTRDEMLVAQHLGVLYYPDAEQNPGDNYLQKRVDYMRGSETENVVLHFNLIYISDNLGDICKN